MRLPILILLFMVTGCATQPRIPPSSCRQFFDRLDRAVEGAGVRDHGATPVADFPYLRVDRFLASFTEEVDEPTRFAAWVERLGRLDREARIVEIANLPAPILQGLSLPHPSREAVLMESDRCRSELITRELATPASRELLRHQAQVPDDYVTGWRVAGLYPITALFVRAGVSRWHREVYDSYAHPLAEIESKGSLTTWSPPASEHLTSERVASLLASSSRNPLGIPEPTPDEREQLFSTFAPQWRIDTVDENDLPGTPSWTATGPVIDTRHPVIFRRLSHTRLEGQVLLQLNYILWFPSRPAEDGTDIYAGPIDGINLRITLGSDGRPLLFDTIHNCGCYQKFFPVAPLLLRKEALELPEPPLVPQLLAAASGTPVIYVGSRAHYVERIDFTPHDDGNRYSWSDYQRLLSLPLEGGGNRSLFGEHGIIAASARPERFILWPMGVRSPGAMRQWGHHATAFVGRRHFDDPFLLETLFRYGAERPQ